VSGDVDHVVDPAEDPKVAVGRLDCAIAREVPPVAPVLLSGQELLKMPAIEKEERGAARPACRARGRAQRATASWAKGEEG
jgi:hypothetical protein